MREPAKTPRPPPTARRLRPTATAMLSIGAALVVTIVACSPNTGTGAATTLVPPATVAPRAVDTAQRAASLERIVTGFALDPPTRDCTLAAINNDPALSGIAAPDTNKALHGIVTHAISCAARPQLTRRYLDQLAGAGAVVTLADAQRICVTRLLDNADTDTFAKLVTGDPATNTCVAGAATPTGTR